MANIVLPSEARISRRLVEPSRFIASASGSVTLIRTGRPRWFGTITIPAVQTSDYGAPEGGTDHNGAGPTITLSDSVYIRLSADSPVADVAMGTVTAVDGSDPSKWTLSDPPSVDDKDIWLGVDNWAYRVEEINGDVVRVAPALTVPVGSQVYRITRLLGIITGGGDTAIRPAVSGPWSYDWEEIG